VRTPWVVGQLWGAPRASEGGDIFARLLLLWAKIQTVELFRVVKTVLARAMWTAEYSRKLILGLDQCQFLLRMTLCPKNHSRWPYPGDVIPPKTSYNPINMPPNKLVFGSVFCLFFVYLHWKKNQNCKTFFAKCIPLYGVSTLSNVTHCILPYSAVTVCIYAADCMRQKMIDDRRRKLWNR